MLHSMLARVKIDNALDNLASKAFSVTFELFECNAAQHAPQAQIP